MINTIQIKQEQLTNGYFKVGSGEEKILIMGSCRVCPYVEYFHQWNIRNGNRFTIYSLDPFNFNWNIKDERVDYVQSLERWETDERMLDMLKSVDIFIHEYYQNAGMFNVNSNDSSKTIYDFGMSPIKALIPLYGVGITRESARLDICLPNFNDYFILFHDIVAFDLDIRKKAIQDYNVLGKLSEQTKKEMYQISIINITKFYNVCDRSSIPEMKEYFKENITTTRFWHSYNHVTKYFTLAMFWFLNDKYLNLNLSSEFWEQISKDDLFDNSFTPLSEFDVELFGYDWGENIVALRNKLF